MGFQALCCFPGSYLPEVLNHGILLLVSTVVRVLDPVIHIDLRYTSYEQLELTLIEDVDKIRRDQLVEPSDKCVELLVNSFDDSPLRDQTSNMSV